MSIETMKLALAALETCRIRSVSEWSVEDITPKNVTAAIEALRAAIQQAEAQQPATGEPVEADSSEHLRVVASLGDALRRLSFAAQTTGGTAGPDAELQSAIGQAEQALSLGGIWQAMSATGETVVDVRCEGCGYMTHHREHMGCVRAAKQHTHPAPSVPADVVRDAERYRWLKDRNNKAQTGVGCWESDDHFTWLCDLDADEAIDAAMLADTAEGGD